ncbi:MAG: lactate racemase domain-containing protein [Promethearchaeota archaeon]
MGKTFKVPWAAWREPDFLDLKFPDSWNVSLCKMKGENDSELTTDEIRERVINPIGTPNLSELAKGKEKIVIVVDDMTRLTPVSKILPFVFEELEKAKITKDQITILLAIGAHRPMNRTDCILKLGRDVVDTVNIENHHPYENLTYFGESKMGTPIYVNTTYCNSDLKIAIGGVIPHPLAGFGGGAKIVLPGVSGIKTLEFNHSSGRGGFGRVTRIRKDIEEIAEKVGLDFSINVILSGSGKILGVSSGHFKDAHRKAMELGKEAYATEITLSNDVCFLNTFPEDSELSQAGKGFNIFFTASDKMLDEKGCMVLMSSSYEGRGYHSLIAETGAKLYENFGDTAGWKFFMKGRQLYFFSPNISKQDLNHFYPKSVKLFDDWNKLIEDLGRIYGDSPKAAIIPSSIQIAKR